MYDRLRDLLIGEAYTAQQFAGTTAHSQSPIPAVRNMTREQAARVQAQREADAKAVRQGLRNNRKKRAKKS